MRFTTVLLLFFALTASLWAAACGGEQQEAATCQGPDGGLVLLSTFLTGSFSSAAQAAADSDYYDIRLEMLPIWTERTDGYWLYVEQAMASHRDAPYRQRIYHLTGKEGQYRSAVFLLPEEERFVGAVAADFDSLSPQDLSPREGCDIVLERESEFRFVGSTKEGACPSQLRGATWASSRVVVTPDSMISWDRGFDEAGEQVWGAEKGGYVFVRD